MAGIVNKPCSSLSNRINETDAAGAMLEMAKIPYLETGNGLIVPASVSHGVVLDFAEC